ncbi:MAG: hypothetical protein IPH12_03115 [Saprospirales bacterium]|nr:hypothetical protein [Saprospirales bacterium]MBK8921888.1 hypothetical protein [Saprospirales bacterium]
MQKNAFWLAVLLTGCFWQVLPGNTPQTVAQGVLDHLYATNGNYRFKKPRLTISTENNKVAAFSPWKNAIILDQKAYEICRSFGRDSLSALAYILGHELVHAYQAELKSGRLQTNFLAYNRQYSADTRLEKVADVQGLFNAWLAGYQVLNVMPQVIERIYRDYGLTGKILPGYPTLDARKTTSGEVLAIAQDLCDVFEASSYLLVIGRYSLAGAGYEYIMQYYQGAEVQNNLGIAYVLSAQEFWNPQTDFFIYPIEADWHTKLARAASRGQDQLDPTLEPLRADFLEKAAARFRAVAGMNTGYLPARINLVCALNLMGRPAEALKYAEMNLLKHLGGRKKAKGQTPEMIELALGITYALLPGGVRKGEAEAIFKRLSGSGYPLSALYAQQNLQSLHGASANANVRAELPLPQVFRQQISQMELGRTSGLERVALDAGQELFFAKKNDRSDLATFVFSNRRGNLVSLLRVQTGQQPDAAIVAPGEDLPASAYRNIMPARDGFYLKSPANKAVLKVDAKGRVLELVKYVEHGQ